MRQQFASTNITSRNMSRIEENKLQENVVIQPQPPLYDPSYTAPYPGQQMQPALFDANMAMYQQPKDPKAINQPTVAVGPAIPIQAALAPNTAQVAPASQVIISPSNQIPTAVQPGNQATYYAT